MIQGKVIFFITSQCINTHTHTHTRMRLVMSFRSYCILKVLCLKFSMKTENYYSFFFLKFLTEILKIRKTISKQINTTKVGRIYVNGMLIHGFLNLILNFHSYSWKYFNFWFNIYYKKWEFYKGNSTVNFLRKCCFTFFQYQFKWFWLLYSKL